MLKKSQMYSVVVIIFIAAIVLVSIFHFGMRGVMGIYERKCQSELVLMEEQMKGDFDLISAQTGSVSEKRYKMPCGIDKVYFIDMEEELDEDIPEESKLIADSVEAGVKKNVFFMKKGKIFHSLYLLELKLESPYYRCFETAGNERIDVYLKGGYGEADVGHVYDIYDCG